MTDTAVAYGDSLYGLALEEGRAGEMLSDLEGICRLLAENPDYVRVLSEPGIRLDERLGLIEEAFGCAAERYVVSFLKLLCENSLLDQLEGCLQQFRTRYRKDQGILEADVYSAVPLSEEQVSRLQAKLEAISGKKVVPITHVDRRVLGGLRVEMDGMQLDGTLKSRLDGIAAAVKSTNV